VSLAASLAAAYLAAGWSVQLVARGELVPLGAGRPQLARVMRSLALLPATADDVPLAPIDPRVDSVLVTPRGVLAGARPRVGQVVEA
jgi:uncharacterized protein (DUF58 family)